MRRAALDRRGLDLVAMQAVDELTPREYDAPHANERNLTADDVAWLRAIYGAG